MASGLAKNYEIGIGYAIGIEEQVGISVNTFGTFKIDEDTLLKLIHEVFDFKPNTIKRAFGELDFYKLAAYGQAGVYTDVLPWEQTDKLDILKELANDY